MHKALVNPIDKNRLDEPPGQQCRPALETEALQTISATEVRSLQIRTKDLN
jgi:hypothetical protein